MVTPGHSRHGLGRQGLTRRRLVASGSAALAAAAVPGVGRHAASPAAAQDNQVIIQVGGGAWEAAQDVAYFQPFQEETGIEVVRVPPADIGQLRAMVETGNVTFDSPSAIDPWHRMPVRRMVASSWGRYNFVLPYGQVIKRYDVSRTAEPVEQAAEPVVTAGA